METLKPQDAKNLRKLFAKAHDNTDLDGQMLCEVSGEQLDVMININTGDAILSVPCNENGDYVLLTVDNPTLKRWKSEALEAKQIVRRSLSGEKGTNVAEKHGWF